MNDTIHPIRPGIEPGFDNEREIAAFVTDKLRAFAEDYGEPLSIAFVITSAENYIAESWCLKSRMMEGETRAFAAAVLLKKAADS